jgi:glycosyltransferase involved in cell wall biosynthesis
MSDIQKPKVLVFIVAYNAEKTIEDVVSRIPASLLAEWQVDVLIIDDSSGDSTFTKSHWVSRDRNLPFRTTALFNPVNQGYGGNQKLGYRYAIENGYDFVALIHGDGQYAPELLPGLLEPLRDGKAGAVLGSRMLNPAGALEGGMPKYKFAGNRILTWIQNKLLNTKLSEFHTGYRIYSTECLKAIPFERNSNDFHFDTEIIIQMLIAGITIGELPIPTYYGDEICHVNGIKYGFHVLLEALKARLQHAGLLYDPKFDCAPKTYSPYRPKFNYVSPHSLAFNRIRPKSRVLDIGCAGGYLGAELVRRKNCVVHGIDTWPAVEPDLEAFYLHDLNLGLPQLDYAKYDYFVMLDVIEHLSRPEVFLDRLREALRWNPSAEVLVSTANVAYCIPRLMLLIGQFNYGKRGILDLTHTRLFTFSSFERTMRQAGFEILERQGIPGPFPLALGDNAASRFLLRINQFLIRFSRGLFSYQIFLRVKPRPSLEWLLTTAREHSRKRAEAIETAAHEANPLTR